MRRFVTVPTVLVILGLLLIGLVAVPPAMAVYQVGDHVNDFTLPDGQGNMVSLHDYQDRIVLLMFWFYE
jgi:cytochrome oxidase Cu insertion factor (SCO1/SenC/PrrC family)